MPSDYFLFLDKRDEICPTNPNYCMNKNSACDGRNNLCKDVCSNSPKDFPYFNKCSHSNNFRFCGRRQGAKYQNNQCFNVKSKVKGYKCLNRLDISENIIKSVRIFGNSKRKNLFEILETNKVPFIYHKLGWWVQIFAISALSN